MPCIARTFDEFDLRHGELCLQDPHAELWHIGIQRYGFERIDECFAGIQWVNDRVDPKPRGAITWIGLAVVVGTVIGSGVFLKPRIIAQNVPDQCYGC